jgi:streptogramin lyase
MSKRFRVGFRARHAKLLALTALALLAGCSGGGSASPAAPATTAAAPGLQSTGRVTFAISSGAAATIVLGRKPQFVSPAATSVGIAVNGAAATFSDVSSTSPNCTTSGGTRTCTIGISAPAGSPLLAITLYDAANGTGPVLAQGSATPSVTLGQTFSVNVTMAPVVAFLTGGTLTYSSGTSFTPGTPATATYALGAADAASQTIPSTATFANALTLSSTDPHVTVTPASWKTASQTVALTYDGSASIASSVTITVANGSTPLVQKVIATGAALSVTEFAVTTPNSEPVGITSGPDGNLWFAEQTGNNIGRMTTAGVLTEFPVPTLNSAPVAVVTGSDGNLWFTEEQSSLSSKVGRITPLGVVTEFSAGISPFSLPYQIAAGSDGNLYFTEFSGNKIARITTTGVVTEFPIPTLNTQPSYIVSGPDGALWFTQPGTNQIGRMTTAGVFSETTIPTGASAPSGIAVGPDGALWFLEEAPSANKVGRITTAGVVTNEFTIPSANSAPMTIVTGADGNLWFTENANAANKITRMTTAGVFTEFAVPTPNSGPCSTTLGPDNHIWFAENNPAGNKIARI